MIKFFVSMAFLFCILQNAHSQLLYPKDYNNREEKYLPPYDPNVVIISPDVEKWMNEQLTKVGEKKTVEMKTDVLGRVKSSTDKTEQKAKVAESKQKRLVRVSDMHIPQIEMEPMQGRSEYNSKTKNHDYYINGKKVSLKEYENSMEKYWQKFDSQNKSKRNLPISGVINSDSRGWTALMTAEEISTLTKNYKELTIGDYIERIDEAPIANILGLLQITSHASVNNFTGKRVGVGVVEISCRDTSIPIKNISRYTNYCGTSPTSTHHSMVVNTVQHISPDAQVFGFKESSNAYPNPDSYSPRLQIVTYSYGANTDNRYEIDDMDMDNYIYINRIIAFKSAGNMGTNITSPGKALNITTVGAVCPAVPCSGDDNNVINGFVSYSSRYNSEVGNEKPDAAMYTDVNLGIYGDGYVFNGTSAAAPLLAGMVADVLDSVNGYSFYWRQPALMKAALIGAETTAIPNAATWDGDNYKSAQKNPVFSALAWNSRGAWWSGANSSFFNSSDDIEFMEYDVHAGEHIITISWLSDGSYVRQNRRIQQDLDLYVYQNGVFLGSSTSWDNPFESVRFQPKTGDPLRIVIHRYRNSGGNVVLGYNVKYL